MAELFSEVFNPQMIHEMLFMNVKSVLTYPTIGELLEKEPEMGKRWESLAATKYNLKSEAAEQIIYEENAVLYPEFSRIVAISYARVYIEDGTLKRQMKRIANDDEKVVLATFMDELHQLSSDGVKSNPQYFPTLCGHNISKNDIPLLMKRYIYHRDKLEKQIPFMLKRTLSIKPWESGVIDTIDVWKFNGYGNVPLMLISDFIGLKKTVDLVSPAEVSRKYWELVSNEDNEKAIDFVSLQSATQTNLAIQLMNTLRTL